ncbi:MAG TPA: DUF402 domain-containing protein [Lachnospiraceae bacterium]|nr:DUF402 domain-containing protein [Lachnospiraceae bacterium]
MDKPVLFRKRIIPEECVQLEGDTILYMDDEIIVTKWNALKPKKDLHHGYSCYFLKEGYKVSKFYTVENVLMYWYCDIIDYEYNEAKNTYIFTDLLADVIVYPNGFVKVVDINEFVEALDIGKISIEELKLSLLRLDNLLSIIYADKFEKLQNEIEVREEN